MVRVVRNGAFAPFVFERDFFPFAERSECTCTKWVDDGGKDMLYKQQTPSRCTMCVCVRARVREQLLNIQMRGEARKTKAYVNW